MNQRARLRRIESAMGPRGHEPETVMEMSDAELAECIGGPGTRPEDLTDEMLERIAAGE